MLPDQSPPHGRAATERYRAGDLEVDVQARRVVRDGEEVHLTELSFDVLVSLLRRAPAIVSKKTLMREVWPGVVVEPDTVKKRIALLRESLSGDDPGEPLIRVARGRGYGINRNVERLDILDSSSRSSRWRRPHIVPAASVFLMALVAIGLVFRFGMDREEQAPVSASAVMMENAVESDREQPTTSSINVTAIDPVAYQYFIEGKALRRIGRDYLAASKALEKALDIEPRFAPALAELALCRIANPADSGAWQPTGLDSARELAQRALKLAPTLPEAIAAAAAVAIFVDWNWAEADALLKQGLAISPDQGYLLTYRSVLSAIRGDLDESIRLLQSVVAHDVTYARLHYALGQRYYQAGRLREAIQAYRQALKVNPQIEFAHLGIGRIRAMQGDNESALREIALEPNMIFQVYGEVIAHSAAGDEFAATAALEDFERQGKDCCHYWLGALHAYRGNADGAFDFLEAAWKNREVGLLDLKIDPLLAGIRGDARYVELLDRLDLD